MLKEVLTDMRETARGLARNRRAVLLFFVTYVAMLGAAALFVSTSVATIRQVLLTFAALFAAPALFFLLQAMCVSFTETNGAVEMLRRAAKNFWKLTTASIPVIILAVALYLLLGKIESSFVQPNETGIGQRVIFSTMRVLLFGLVVPLASIHLWIELTREETRRVLTQLRPLLSRAFAPRSVTTYVCGLALFGLLPYLLIFSRTPSERAWLELSLLGARLVVALCFILLGWVITVGALHKGTRAEA